MDGARFFKLKKGGMGRDCGRNGIGGRKTKTRHRGLYLGKIRKSKAKATKPLDRSVSDKRGGADMTMPKDECWGKLFGNQGKTWAFFFAGLKGESVNVPTQ